MACPSGRVRSRAGAQSRFEFQSLVELCLEDGRPLVGRLFSVGRHVAAGVGEPLAHVRDDAGAKP